MSLGKYFMGAALCGGLLVASACGDDGGGGSAGEGAGDAATFTEVFDGIIVFKGCNAGGTCHGVPIGNLLMVDKQATYNALVNVNAMGTNLPPGGVNCVDSGLKRVVPGNPDQSLLMQKVLGTQPCGLQMPPGAGNALPAEMIEMIRSWIAAGALNN